jgi:hypothetical protein
MRYKDVEGGELTYAMADVLRRALERPGWLELDLRHCTAHSLYR